WNGSGPMSPCSAAPGSSQAPTPEGAPAARMRVALRTALTLVVVLSVLSTALLIHLSWSYTARRNVADVAAQLNAQIAYSIRNQLDYIQRNPQATQEAVRSIFNQGAIRPEDESKREFVFLALLQAQPALSGISFGWPNGNFFGAEKADEEIHMVEVRWKRPPQVATLRVDRYVPEPEEPLFLERIQVQTDYSVLTQKWY